MSKSKQLAVNTIIVGISKVSSALAVFLVLPLYTKYLSAEQYGFIDLVTVYALLIVPIITIRLELALFRWLIDARKNDKQIGLVITEILKVVFFGLLAFSALYWPIALALELAYAGLIYTYVFLAVLAGVILQAARGLGQIRVFAVNGIINGVLSSAVGAILVVFFDMGVAGVLWGLIAGSLAACIFTASAIRLPKRLVRTKNVLLRKELVSFSLPMVPNGLSGWAIFAGSKVIVSATLGVAANGIYAVAGRFTTLFGGIFEIFNITWTESAALHIGSKDRDVYFSKVFNAALYFFGSAAIMFIAVLPIIFPWFVNESFNEAYLYIPVLTVGFLFDTTVRMIGGLYVALRLTKQVMYTTITAALISIIGTLILVEPLGLWAPVLASCVAFVSMSIYRYIDIRKRGIGLTIRPMVVVLTICGLAVVLTVYYVIGPNLIINLITCLAAGVFALLVNKSTIKLILSLKPQRKKQ